jgi:hypothetical protein
MRLFDCIAAWRVALAATAIELSEMAGGNP